MTPVEMHSLILTKMLELKPGFKMHALHEAMLMECCENVLQPHNTEKYSNDILMISALQAFEVANNMMKGLLSGAIQAGDVITLNYRGATYTFDKESPMVKIALMA